MPPPTSSTSLWNSEQGRAYLARAKGIDAATIAALAHFGFSSTCNVLAAIKTAKLLDLGPDDALITVATDGGAMYSSERSKMITAALPRRVQPHRRRRGVRHATSATSSTEHMIELREADRRRIFNLGYYTWVEQQGTPFELFEQRRHQDFWRGLRRYLGVWDEMIADFNARVAAA